MAPNVPKFLQRGLGTRSSDEAENLLFCQIGFQSAAPLTYARYAPVGFYPESVWIGTTARTDPPPHLAFEMERYRLPYSSRY